MKLMTLLMAQVADTSNVSSSSSADGTEILIIFGILLGTYIFFTVVDYIMNKQLAKINRRAIDTWEEEIVAIPAFHIFAFIYLLVLIIYSIPEFYRRRRNIRKNRLAEKIKAKKEKLEAKARERLKNIVDI